jgi:hypothetical protein
LARNLAESVNNRLHKKRQVNDLPHLLVLSGLEELPRLAVAIAPQAL